ncbi:MAG: hypothetical protein IJY62_01400 [Clostridia bacterium]|nr:hypothetical protein [Clostridia bacterium]
MKKKLTVVIAAALTITTCLSMTACKGSNSVSGLIPKTKGKYSIAVKEITNFSSEFNYSKIQSADSNGVVLLSKTAKNVSDPATAIPTYTLYNVGKNKDVVSDVTETIEQINDTLYCTYNSAAETYTLYDSASGVYASDVNGTIDDINGIFTYKDGTRIYVAPNGKVKKETNPFDKILSKNATKIGDYYLEQANEDGTLDIYNKKGEWKRTVNLKTELDIPATATLTSTWTVENRIFFQITRALPDTETDYDYYENATKWDLDTFYYNFERGTSKELKKFNYYVSNVNQYSSWNDRTAVATVQKINDKALGQKHVQSFNKNGKVAVDLQKLVPGATSAFLIDTEKIALFNGTDYAYVYKGAKRVATIPSSYQLIGNYVYDYSYSDQTLDIFDFKGKSVLSVEGSVPESTTYNQQLIYSVKPKVTEETPTTYTSFYVFNPKKGTSTLIGTNSETVTYEPDEFGYNVQTVSGAVTTNEYHFYGCDTVLNGEFDELFSYYNLNKGKAYTIIEVENNGVTAFYSIVVSFPYIK